jgi:hypothetical protein
MRKDVDVGHRTIAEEDADRQTGCPSSRAGPALLHDSDFRRAHLHSSRGVAMSSQPRCCPITGSVVPLGFSRR